MEFNFVQADFDNLAYFEEELYIVVDTTFNEEEDIYYCTIHPKDGGEELEVPQSELEFIDGGEVWMEDIEDDEDNLSE